MPYQRKTADEWQIHGNYGQGFEEVTAESSRREALARLREYRDNEPGIAFKLIKRRVPLTPACD